MRIVFFGTPEFAVPSLEVLHGEHDIALVVAQPDKPSGRGMRMHAPPVAEKARLLRRSLDQPERIRRPEFLERVADVRPEVGIVVAYGKVLPASLLAIPTHGFLNVHASVLPKYRGAAPIQRAIEAGETTTGVSIMGVDEELDHGPVYDFATVDISPHEHTPSLARRLSTTGADLLAQVLRAIESGSARATPQDDSAATYAPKIEKREGRVEWDASAKRIYDRFRAFDPWPGVFIDAAGGAIRITSMTVASERALPGLIVSLSDLGIVVGTGEGAVRLLELQRPGKRSAKAVEVAHSQGWGVGDRLP
ncbi:MAG TPA: methionyl-tRNA formyltransferase [Thermoanaerobaculia bacterium]|nr:methionyl-tRNA formyltransferase [Thermoanaerobaculia bacterium]